MRRTYPNLRAFLDASGQSQAEFAAQIGLSQGYLSRLIRGLQQPPLDLALRIAQAARIPVESLVSKTDRIPVEK